MNHLRTNRSAALAGALMAEERERWAAMCDGPVAIRQPKHKPLLDPAPNQPTLDGLAALRTKILSMIPTAIIAGGSVRDAILGRPIRDVDVFFDATADWVGHQQATAWAGRELHNGWTPTAKGVLWKSPNERPGLVSSPAEDAKAAKLAAAKGGTILGGLGQGADTLAADPKPDEYSDDDDRRIVSVLNVRNVFPIQLIGLNGPPAEYAAAFPLTIAQCWVGEEGQLHTSRAFRRDRIAQVLRFVGDRDSEKQVAWAWKVASKYPSWTRVGFPDLYGDPFGRDDRGLMTVA